MTEIFLVTLVGVLVAGVLAGVGWIVKLVFNHEKTDAALLESVAGINTRLDGIDSRLDRMDTRMDRVDDKLSTVVESLARIEGKLSGTA